MNINESSGNDWDDVEVSDEFAEQIDTLENYSANHPDVGESDAYEELEQYDLNNQHADTYRQEQIQQAQEDADAYQEATELSRSATLTFVDFPLVMGGDGRRHAYAMVGGNPLSGELRFRLKIQNRNDHLNLTDTRLRLRFTTKRSDNNWYQINLAGQSEGARYLSIRSEDVEDESSLFKTISINRGILQQAYDSESPLVRLEVEFHWKEAFSSTDYYVRTALTFHLMQPVELLMRTAQPDGQIDTVANTPLNRRFRIPIWEKYFSRRDREPVVVSHSITTSMSQTQSNTISVSTRASETRGSSTTVSSQVSSTQGAEAGISLGDVVELGMSSSRSFSFGVSNTVSQSITREIANSMSRSSSYTSGISGTFSLSSRITPARAGMRRILVAYPNFTKLKVDIVRFSNVDGNGWAQARRVFRRVPIVRLSNWGYRQIDRRPQGSAESELSVLNEQSFYAPIEQEETNPSFLAEAGANRKLRASEIKYIVMEGGGGKGLVYLGAIRALEQVARQNGQPVLSYRSGRLVGISGIAGSSAGAITALGLSMGMNAAQLERISDPRYKNFQEFFDKPSLPRKIPMLNRSCATATDPGVLDRYLYGPAERAIAASLSSIPGGYGNSVASSAVNSLKRTLYTQGVRGLNSGGSITDKLLSPALVYYAQNMVSDLGIFSGCLARDFLADLIRQRGGTPNMNFRDHYNRFGVKLKITGSNLETGATNIFSADHTPMMAVADAVRISMGLPVLFKPVRITATQARQIVRGASIRPASSTAYAGLYVDGGLWNNLPMPLFATEEQRTGPGTLGLALGRGSLSRSAINHAGDFFGALIGRFTGDDALANAYPSYRRQIITLDTGSIGTADFSPNRAELARMQAAAQQRVRAYF